MLLEKIKNKLGLNQAQVKGFYPLSETCQIPKLTLIYEQYFGKITDGTFVEVGAYDGEYVSNTSGLADVGWKGIYIEPVPQFYKKCKARHTSNKKVNVVNAAAGAAEGSIVLHIGGPLSTVMPNMKEKFKKLDWAKSSFKNDETCNVEVMTLSSILEANRVQIGFEVLVIDVEGYEWDVLQGFDINCWLPDMIVIELHDQNDDYFDTREKHISIIDYLDEADYKVIYKDFTNTVYVRNGCFPLSLGDR